MTEKALKEYHEEIEHQLYRPVTYPSPNPNPNEEIAHQLCRQGWPWWHTRGRDRDGPGGILVAEGQSQGQDSAWSMSDMV